MSKRKTPIVFTLIMFLFMGAMIVVGLLTSAPDRPGPYAGVVVLRDGDVSAGSGFVFDATKVYYFVGTAAHVVRDLNSIEVDGIEAEVIARNNDLDIAILRVQRYEQKYRVYRFGVGKLEQNIRAVGYTWGNGFNDDPTFMVYHGKVTCINWESCLASNCGAFPGMSGGPLLNKEDQVVGIVSRCASAWSTPVTTLSIFVPSKQLQMLWGEYLAGDK